MLKPSKQAIIDVFHDDTVFAQQVIAEIKRLRVAQKLRFLKLHYWSSQDAPAHPTIIISHELSKQLLQPLCCAEQLLIVPEAPSIKDFNRWGGELAEWPEHPAHLARRIERMAQHFNTAQQLNAVRDSLTWHTRRVEREHELIEHIFRNALSRNFLDYPHIRTLLAPAAKFNGDLCLVAPGPQGNLYVMMADFTGHGLAPATGALPLSQAFFAMADRGVSIAEMVTEFNYRLNRLLPNDMFCACFVLELAASGERLTYWNGGMPPVLVYGADGIIRHRLKAQHMALGVLREEEFDAQVGTIKTQASDHLALYTDGVIEMLSQQQQFLGAETFEDYLARYPRLADFDQLVKQLETFRGNQPLHDDLSLAILQCKPTGFASPGPDNATYALPFSFTCELGAEELQHLDVVSAILSVLGRLPKLRSHRTTVYLLLAEVFNNALEHGLLQLDSRMKEDPDGFAYYYQLRAERLAELTAGSITIHVHYQPQQHYLHFTLEHSGVAWEWPQEVKDAAAQTRSYGRGLELLQQLADGVQWHDGGKRIAFGYYLSATDSTAS